LNLQHAFDNYLTTIKLIISPDTIGFGKIAGIGEDGEGLGAVPSGGSRAEWSGLG